MWPEPTVTVEAAISMDCVHRNGSKCTAARCMAWRWSPPLEVSHDDRNGLRASEVGLNESVVGDYRRFVHVGGWCGLASR